ncbi:hypothetical protein CLOSTMETH_02280 [[Clostridium] methylpentosum DSM 5476]|uniref:Uncharacterized protein n=1 Tax=[Clostridium] methylpentosum DSM 5476 TaxID=537013 RepID=C0EEJ3_9FIRM|nr:hypothetical protein CLOSTMETH_02280 [[Clostridium] methylpentosum DSM 5476]
MCVSRLTWNPPSIRNQLRHDEHSERARHRIGYIKGMRGEQYVRKQLYMGHYFNSCSLLLW